MDATFFVTLTVKATLLLLVTWGVAALLWRAAAAARSLVWSAGLVGVLALPGLMASAPAWRLELLPAPLTSLATATLPGMPDADSTGSGRSGFPDPWQRDGATGASIDQPGARRAAAPLLVLLLGLWALGVVVGLGRLGGALWSLSTLRREARPADDPAWAAETGEACAALRMHYKPDILISGRTAVPAVFGVLRPVLLLPADSAEWSASRRRAVILHELAHVKRRDCLVQILAESARVLYWFHPLAHLAVSKLRDERERACDDVVLNAGTSATEYADHLCDLVSNGLRLPSVPAVALGVPSKLNRRLRAILDEDRHRTAPRFRSVLAGMLVAGLAVLGLGGIRLSAGPAGGDRLAVRVDPAGGGVIARDISATTRARAADAIAVALRDENAEIRVLAARVVEAVRANPDRSLHVEVPCRGNCYGVGDGVLDAMLRLNDEAARLYLASDDPADRLAAIRRLSGVTEPGAAALARALIDADPSVRVMAAIRLDSKHAIVAVPNWIALLRDEDPMLRERAAISLGVIGDPRAIDPLGDALRDRETAVRLQAAKALASIALGDDMVGTNAMPAAAPAQSRQVYRPGNGVTLPLVITEVRAGYTPAAMAARIEGSVLLDAVVEADGSVSDVAVVKSLDQQHGLDAEAIAALRQWQFKPGLREAKPVAVRIAVEMTFTLR
jgi:TonB family protein